MNKKIGIIGGLGPMATVKFIEILNENILDEENISYVVINNPKTPDRTQYIIDKSNPNPINTIIDMIDKLDKYNVDIITMPCNTASYFYEEILKYTNTKFINIVDETVLYIRKQGIKKIGLLATSGTIKSGVYKHFCDKYDIEYIVPELSDQEKIMNIIYDGVKASKPFNIDNLYSVTDNLKNKGAQKIVLGCTELSVLYKDKIIKGDIYVDSMETLAKSALKKVGSIEDEVC